MQLSKLSRIAAPHRLCLAVSSRHLSFHSSLKSQSETQLSRASIHHFRPSLVYPVTSHRSYATASRMSAPVYQDPAIKDVLDFWFGLPHEGWFQESSKYDKVIIERFGKLVDKARLTNELDEIWLSTPAGSLALIVLLDQFTRNIFRKGNHANPGLSWSGDAKALRIAADSIAKGYDIKVQEQFPDHFDMGFSHRYFFYMPFEHAEDLPSQIAAVSLFQRIADELEINRLQKLLRGEQETEQEKEVREWMIFGVSFAERHRACILACGRFPSRNEPLGRDHTVEDKKWLEEHPAGF